jgi:hypothetical protein
MYSSNNFDIAHLSTAMNVTYVLSGGVAFVGENSGGLTQSTMDSETRSVINFQLAFWKDAKEKYNQRIKNNNTPLLSDMVLVISSLFLSLTFLFGVNFQKRVGNISTPSLISLINSWHLGKDNSDLYRRFCEINSFFKINIRHTDYDKISSNVIVLTKEKLERFYETTRELWVWFIKKYCEKYNNGNVPPELLIEF